MNSKNLLSRKLMKRRDIGGILIIIVHIVKRQLCFIVVYAVGGVFVLSIAFGIMMGLGNILPQVIPYVITVFLMSKQL